jgi:single-stranded-DNA-specific exonuclease
MAVLGVTKSFGGCKWVGADVPERDISLLCQKYQISDFLARLLLSRGVGEKEVPSFLTPTLRNNLPDPCILKDMEKGAARVAQAVLNKESIGIIGDYDVDGATSTSVVKLFLEYVGCSVETFIPEREDGYGPNAREMKRFFDKGIRLVLTVDCGMTAFEPIQAAYDLNMEVIVIDHHEPEVSLPKAYAVINPKRLDEPKDNPCHHLAAVGVCFLFVVALNRILRQSGFYEKKALKEPDLKQWLDLVALGTVCDVVKLTGVNRLYVKTGLKQIRTGHNIGIRKLAEFSHLQEELSTYHLGYVLGPLLNAGGRVGESSAAMRLLSSRSEREAEILTQQLADHNAERKKIESDVLSSALKQVEADLTPQSRFLFAAGENWHQGVIGIIAGRLKEKYNLPAFVLSIEKDEVKGSSRSVPGVDLGETIMAALDKKVLTRGGGHPMAAGFSLTKEQITPFKSFLEQYLLRFNQDEKNRELKIDAVLDVKGASLNLVDELSDLEPFGEGNPEPRFALKDVWISQVVPLKNGHLKCTLCGKNGGSLSAIAFRSEGTPLGQALLACQRDHLIHIAGVLKENVWQGRRSAQFIIQDAAQSAPNNDF